MKNTLIFTPRCKLAYAIEFLFTLVMWGAFIYLFFHSVVGSLKRTSLLDGMDASDLLAPSTGSLTAYALVALVNGAIVVVWAKYNAFRGKEERRKPVAHLSAEELAASFGIGPAVLHTLQASRVMTVHHDEHGAIARVESGSAHSPALMLDPVGESTVLPVLVPVRDRTSVLQTASK